ncbi:MAG: glycosyltransferase [Kofleriaceae bacterium]|nr:glycosyltransferase [Kofleriaceae bacterium]MBP9169788.1 glycosyltransferase [Kofleriaceae bacterium]MBP9858121.1 glycosyltransferase [Kofleriaceae bacterium]
MSVATGAVWAVYLTALAVLALYGLHRLTLVVRARRRRPAAAPCELAAAPVVTVALPLYNERAVAARAIAAAASLDWPRDRLEVQVLDDSTDDTAAIVAAEVAAWRARGVDVVHLRRTTRTGWKAGALDAGRAVARGELHAVFDADFVPPPDFLRQTVGAFADPGVAMVQARWAHLNRDASLLTRLQALLLDGHFAVEQAGRAAVGACWNFNGTAGVWRATAIADAGGWQADTLTEDLDLSYRAALAGWRFVYADAVRAPAELPADLAAFKAQQFRWAKGSIECARKLVGPIATSTWPWWRRLEALFHLTHNLPYLITLVALIAGGAAIAAGGGPAWAPVVHATSMATTALVLAVFVAASDRPRLGALARIPALIALTAGMAVSQSRAVVLGAIGRVTPFERTPKDGAIGRASAPRRYRAASTGVGLLEAALALYLAGCGSLALVRGAVVAPLIAGWLALGVAAIAISGLRGRVAA